jgi:uridine phosphorylase
VVVSTKSETHELTRRRYDRAVAIEMVRKWPCTQAARKGASRLARSPAVGERLNWDRFWGQVRDPESGSTLFEERACLAE